jgi:CubicO group peptidase (beta-lactamase class C family)
MRAELPWQAAHSPNRDFDPDTRTGPATVRHLLTHSARRPELVYPSRAFKPILGGTVRFGQRVPTLAEFDRGGLRLVAEPGTRHLGQVAEDAGEADRHEESSGVGHRRIRGHLI